jgi:hypothetical protein
VLIDVFTVSDYSLISLRYVIVLIDVFTVSDYSLNKTHKTKDRTTRAPLKPGVNAGAPEG